MWSSWAFSDQISSFGLLYLCYSKGKTPPCAPHLDVYAFLWNNSEISKLLQSGSGGNCSKHVRPEEHLRWNLCSTIRNIAFVRSCFRVCCASGDDAVVFKCDYSCVISTRRLFTGAALQQTDAVNPLCFCVQMSCFVYLWLSLICCVCVLMLSWVTVCSLLSRGEHERREKLFSSWFSCSQNYSWPDKLTMLLWGRHLGTSKL